MKGITAQFRDLAMGEQIEVELYDRPSLHKIARRVQIKVSVSQIVDPARPGVRGFYVTRVPGTPTRPEEPRPKRPKAKKEAPVAIPDPPVGVEKAPEPVLELSPAEKLAKLREMMGAAESGVPKAARPTMQEPEPLWFECGTEWDQENAEMWMMEKNERTGAIRPKYRVEDEYAA